MERVTLMMDEMSALLKSTIRFSAKGDKESITRVVKEYDVVKQSLQLYV
jgi:hypothetical protein